MFKSYLKNAKISTNKILLNCSLHSPLFIVVIDICLLISELFPNFF